MEKTVLFSKEFNQKQRAEYLKPYLRNIEGCPPSTAREVRKRPKHKLEESPNILKNVRTAVMYARVIAEANGLGMEVIRYEDVYDIILYSSDFLIFHEFKPMMSFVSQGFIKFSKEVQRFEVHLLLRYAY